MKRIQFFYLPLLFVILLHNGKAQKLYGCVYEQNSGGKIVAGVTIKPTRGNAITSDNTGRFTLFFPEMKPGMPVQMSAIKTGWRIVNPEDLETLLPVDNISHTHSITMCREADWNKKNSTLTTALAKEMAKNIIKEVVKGLKDSSKKSAPAVDEQRVAQQVQRAPEMAIAINSVNQDQVSDTERTAYRLVLQDSFGKASQVREQLESKKNFEPALNEALAGDSRKLEIHRRNLVEQSRLALLELNFEKADSDLAFLANHDTLGFKSQVEYAQFKQQRMQYDSAIVYYKRAAAVAPTIFQRLQAWNSLGNLYRLTNAYEPAEQVLKLSLDSSMLLTDSNLAISGAYLASAQTNLGLLYRAKGNYPDAEKAFKTALSIRLKQIKLNPDFFNPLLAALYINLGALYNDNSNYGAAEQCYSHATAIYGELAIATPNLYDPQLATLYNNMGLMQTEQKNYGSAKNHFKTALSILRKLYTTNPLAYKGEVAETLLNQGDLYRKSEEYELAEQAYQEALQFRKEMAETVRTINTIRELANVQFRIGLLRADEKDTKGATTFLQQAQQNQLQLIDGNSVMVYGPLLADIEYSLGELYRQQKTDTAAEKWYRHVLDIRRQMTDSLPGSNKFQVAITYWSLGVLYEDRKNYPSAEDNLQQAYETYKRLARDTLEPYAADAGHNAFMAATRLGNVLYYQGRYDVAARTQQDALNMAKQLSQEQPGKYDEDIANLQTNLGISYSKKNDYTAAQQAYWAAATTLQHLKNSKPATYGNSFSKALVLWGEVPATYKSPATQPIYQKMLAEALELDPALIDGKLRERLKKLQQAPAGAQPG